MTIARICGLQSAQAHRRPPLNRVGGGFASPALAAVVSRSAWECASPGSPVDLCNFPATNRNYSGDDHLHKDLPCIIKPASRVKMHKQVFAEVLSLTEKKLRTIMASGTGPKRTNRRSEAPSAEYRRREACLRIRASLGLMGLAAVVCAIVILADLLGDKAGLPAWATGMLIAAAFVAAIVALLPSLGVLINLFPRRAGSRRFVRVIESRRRAEWTLHLQALGDSILYRWECGRRGETPSRAAPLEEVLATAEELKRRINLDPPYRHWRIRIASPIITDRHARRLVELGFTEMPASPVRGWVIAYAARPTIIRMRRVLGAGRSPAGQRYRAFRYSR